MSHGDHHEPSHGEHHERPEPVRTPIPDPGKGFMVVHKEVREDGNKWITTHQGPNGDFYTIENASTPEANMTLYNENVRNAKLKDAMANGLYRLSSDQLRLTRPAAPSDQFLATLEHAGVSDSFTGSAGGFISYGRGPKGKNEKAAIDERSASIVLSYQARDKALAEGKSPEEAQDIGAQVYNDQESYKETSRVSPGENVQPEIISGDRTAPNPAPPARPIPKSSAYAHPRSTVSAPSGHVTETATHASVETASEPTPPTSTERLSSKEKREKRAAWFRKTGFNARVAAKVHREVGPIDTPHFAIHKSIDGLRVPKDAVVEKAKSLFTAAIEAGRTSLDTVRNTPSHVASLYRATFKAFETGRDTLGTFWTERRKQATERKTSRNKAIDAAAADRIAAIFGYLSDKHPDDEFYKMYKDSPTA